MAKSQESKEERLARLAGYPSLEAFQLDEQLRKYATQWYKDPSDDLKQKCHELYAQLTELDWTLEKFYEIPEMFPEELIPPHLRNRI
jgi:hypothetical protein